MEKEEIRIKQRYKIEKVLGQGGFGVTYLAYDEELCQEVVLKKYRWEHGSLDNEVINKRDYYKKQRKAFLNECIRHLVCYGAALDQARNFQVFVQTHVRGSSFCTKNAAAPPVRQRRQSKNQLTGCPSGTCRA